MQGASDRIVWATADREEVLIHAPRLFLWIVSLATTTAVATALVGSFDPMGFRHVLGVRSGAPGGRPALSSEDFPEPTPDVAPIDPTDVDSTDAEGDLGRSEALVFTDSDARVQATIDELAARIALEPTLATALIAAVEGHSRNHRSSDAEKVLAALGRADAGIDALIALLHRGALSARLRGATYLALVQGVCKAPDHVGSTSDCAWARTACGPPPDPVVEVFRDALANLSRPKGIDRVERERFFVAGASSGAFSPDELARLLDAKDDATLHRIVVTGLVRARDADRVISPLRRAWLHDPDRVTRKIAAGALARYGHALLEELASLVVGAGPSDPERMDALSAIGLRTSFDDGELTFAERAIDQLGRWALSSPILRDDDPGPDARAGPDAKSYEVAGRDRVRALAHLWELDAGGRSTRFAPWVTSLAPLEDR